jgi:hypothetical protein
MPLNYTGLQFKNYGISMANVFLKLFFVLIMGLYIAGCAHPITIVGEVGPEIDADRVDIYYPDSPKCNFNTVAYIRVEGGFYSLNSLIKHMRLQAANVGADAVYIMQTQRLDIKQFTGVAKAIKCEAT